ncbi:MAG: RIP metalloprotease RseP [Chloroflexi bacterium]|nr:RIP metalloprotease RseP [Chloroflexota bacterium]
MSDFLLGVASFALVLIPLVILHELGHFIAAKLVGITVLEFGLGFPPRAKVLFTHGGTEYTLNWLPFGGFVRPYGEDFVKPKSEDEMSADRREIMERGIKNAKSVFQAGPWERMFFMAAGPGMNFIVALVLFILVGLIGQPFARADVTVYDLMPDSPAAEAGLQRGDVILELNGEEVESADQFNEMIANHSGESITLLVERDGDTFEAALTARAVEGTDIEWAYITTVEEDMPAFEAGLLPEDVIVAVDDVEITSIEQLQEYTREREGQAIQVTILRDGERLVIPITPVEDSAGVARMGIGISPVQPAAIGLTAVNVDAETYTRPLPFGEAVREGVDQFVETHRLLFQFVQDLFAGRVDPSAARPVSPIGIGQIGAPVLDQTLEEEQAYPIILFAAMISIALAVTNLLPIPGLDGGRILFVVIELIRGKPMEPEREGAIHLIGVLLLLGLIVFTLINDIVNPIDLDSFR